MQPLQDWSFARVLLACGAWLLALVLIATAWLFLLWRDVRTAGSGGIGAVSVGIGPVVLGVIFGPPLALIVAWSIARWLRSP
jgi:hypothetical protein